MNEELVALFHADQQERQNHPAYGTPDYWALRERDRERRERVRQLLAEDNLQKPEDYYHAAMIFQHGEEIVDIKEAYDLALHAAQLGYSPARWLAAAAYDRWLMYQGQPQKYGTQIVPDGKRYRVWDVDPTTTDAERAEWHVPPLREQEVRAERLTTAEPMPPMDQAPDWLKAALPRWQKEE